MATYQGKILTTQNTPQNLFVPDISDRIIEFMPDRFPLDTIMRALGRSRPVEAYPKFEWLEDRTFPRRDIVTAAVNVNNVTSATLTVGNPAMWGPTDVLVVPNSPINPTRLIVTGKSGNQITVGPIDGSTPFSLNLAANSTIVRISNTVGELTAFMDSRSVMPELHYNYVQVFMTVLEFSKIRERVRTYSGDDWQRNVQRHIYDFRSSMEFQLLLGKRAFYPGYSFPDGRVDNLYQFGGILEFAGKQITYNPNGSPPISWQNFVSWTRVIFADNSASEERLFFVGSGLLEKLLKVEPMAQIFQNVGTSEYVHNIRFTRIETNFGVLLLRHHKGLDEAGLPDVGLVVDVNYITRRVLEPMTTTEIELDRTGVRRSRALRIHEAFGVEIGYPEAHAVIYPA